MPQVWTEVRPLLLALEKLGAPVRRGPYKRDKQDNATAIRRILAAESYSSNERAAFQLLKD